MLITLSKRDGQLWKAFAHRVSRLRKQLFGLCGVIRQAREIGIVSRNAGWQHAIRFLRGSVERYPDDLILVDSHGEGLTHFLLFERLEHRLVQRQIPDIGSRELAD